MALTSTRWSWLPTPTRMDARQIATDELRVLLESDNWQDRITAAWLAAFDRRAELHDEIAEHLQSDDDMIGVVQGCSFALARFGTADDAATLAAYLDRALAEPGFSQPWALGALLYLDTQLGTAARFLTPGGAWEPRQRGCARARGVEPVPRPAARRHGPTGTGREPAQHRRPAVAGQHGNDGSDAEPRRAHPLRPAHEVVGSVHSGRLRSRGGDEHGERVGARVHLSGGVRRQDRAQHRCLGRRGRRTALRQRDGAGRRHVHPCLFLRPSR